MLYTNSIQMPNDCVFCKIVAKEIPSKIVYEDELCLAFHDINPRARVHLLVIPKTHIPTLKEMHDSDELTLGRMMKTSRDIAKQFELTDYKVQMSVGKNAGQEVFHIHLHITSVA